MVKKIIVKEEVAELKKSPYIESVSPQKVKFTADFKRMAYQEMTDGKTMREILRESGIKPEILGDARIWGLAKKVRDQSEREGGFEDQREKNMRKPKKMTEEQTMAERIEQLEHELAYTRQEVEFLKKLHAANMEAQKKWESRHRQE